MNVARSLRRAAIAAYDVTYRSLHRLDTPGSEVRPALRIEIRRARRAHRLRDGTAVRIGDRIGVLHIDNARVSAFRARRETATGVGLEFRRQVLASLATLAERAAPGAPLADIRAFTATTIFHRGLQRLGFEIQPDGHVWPHVIAAYQRALLAYLNPAALTLLHGRKYARAERAWISRERLLALYAARAKTAV